METDRVFLTTCARSQCTLYTCARWRCTPVHLCKVTVHLYTCARSLYTLTPVQGHSVHLHKVTVYTCTVYTCARWQCTPVHLCKVSVHLYTCTRSQWSPSRENSHSLSGTGHGTCLESHYTAMGAFYAALCSVHCCDLVTIYTREGFKNNI